MADGVRSPGTVQTYRGQLKNHVLPTVGELRLGELTTPVVDRVIRGIKGKTSAATAKTCRSVVSGVMSLAVRQGAVAHNPVREVSRLETPSNKQPRPLTAEERVALTELMYSHELALRHDLGDRAFFMLATGVRIGEALALEWHQTDLEVGSADVTSTLIRVSGEGLLRKGRSLEQASDCCHYQRLPSACFANGSTPVRNCIGRSFLTLRAASGTPTNVRRSFRTLLAGTSQGWVVDTHVPKDRCDCARRGPADCARGRRPPGPFADLDDAGRLFRASPRGVTRSRGARRCCQRNHP